MRTRGGGGGSERTHLPAIIFALRIIIASCVDGTSLTPSTRPCWKTYVGRRESHKLHITAMYQLGCGLFEEKQYEDAYAVFESLVRNGRPLWTSNWTGDSMILIFVW